MGAVTVHDADGEEQVKNWKALAENAGLDLSAEELERVARALTGLEQTFRPLVDDLSPEIEPSTIFQLGENS